MFPHKATLQQLVLLLLPALLLCNTLSARGDVVLNICKAAKAESTVDILDARPYRKEVGKFKVFDKPRWDKVQLEGGFVPALRCLHDSLARRLNMTQAYLIRIRSFYLQETKVKGTSTLYARLHYLADYYVQNKDQGYRLVYTADTSHLMQTYLLPVTAVSEIKILLNAFMIRCKNGMPGGASRQRAELQQSAQLPERERELMTVNGIDGLFYSWSQLASNQPERTREKIQRIAGLGEMKLIDTLNRKKSTLSLFTLYAYMRQGILYQCTRFGSFPLLNINRQYYFVGYHENYFTFRPDLYRNKRVNKKGGYTLTPEDVEHQKYLFRIDPLTGRPAVVCSITPQDDYTRILMDLSKD